MPNTTFTKKISGWDAVALLAGAVATVLVLQFHKESTLLDEVLWFFIPSTFVYLRRRLLPMPESPPGPVTPPTPLRRALGWVLMVVGGFVMIFAGTAMVLAAQGSERLGFGISVLVIVAAGWLIRAGFLRAG